ncbi:hypothetical protein CEQ90_10330 [Lewinellaceae bacterium SD302]|nr:hypothetical protein CEQ90_10330 [Lewinellaceae bacterium SD302]
MKSILRLFTLLLFCGLAFGELEAQFGVSGFYKVSQDDVVTEEYPDGNFFGNGYEVAADYWFRLPNKRIEFLPTVFYGRYEKEYEIRRAVDSQVFPVEANLSEFGFQLKTNFYIFDFGTDCDCPTWGKQGPALHKGFFLQLAPGISRLTNSFTIQDEELFERRTGSTNFILGVGAGIDFGISNLITITPQVSYRHRFGESDLYSSDYDNTGLISLDYFTEQQHNFLFGLRLGIRLDERRY